MEITVKVDGKEVKVKQDTVLDMDYGTSPYAIQFDEDSSLWTTDREYNKYFLAVAEQFANDKLRARGYLFLNEVYDALGIARTKAGQVMGWVYDPGNPNNHNHVDLDISNKRNDGKNVFILDPNVDGCILDKI